MANIGNVQYNVNKTIKGKTISALNNEVCLDINMDSINANTIGQIIANPGGTYIDLLDNQGFINPEYVLYKQDGEHDFTELPEYLNGDISSNPYLSYSHNGTTVYAYNNFHQYTQDGLSCYANEEDLSQEAKNCLAEIFAGDNNFMNFLYSISTASSSEIENIIKNVYGLEFLSNLFNSYTLIEGYYGFNLSNNGYVAVSFIDAFSAKVENYTNQNDKYEADISIEVNTETGEFMLIVSVSEIEEAFGSPVYTDYFWTCISENGTYYIGRVKVDGFPQSDSPVVNNYIDAATPYINDYKADNANWVQTNVVPETLYYDMFTFDNITFSKKGNSDEIMASINVMNGLASDSIIVDSIYLDIVSGEDTYQVNFLGDGSEIPAGGSGTVYGTSTDLELLTISGVYTITDFQYQDIMPTYTVYYETISVPNGENASHVDPEGVLEGSYPTRPSPNPTNDGYVFGGWYTDTSYTTQFDFNSPIFGDTYVYALWVSSDVTLETGDYLYIDGMKIQSVLDNNVSEDDKIDIEWEISTSVEPVAVIIARGTNGEYIAINIGEHVYKLVLFDGETATTLRTQSMASIASYVNLDTLIFSLPSIMGSGLFEYQLDKTITFNSVFDIEIMDGADTQTPIREYTNDSANIKGIPTDRMLDIGRGDYIVLNGVEIKNILEANLSEEQMESISFPATSTEFRVLRLGIGDGGASIGIYAGEGIVDFCASDGSVIDSLAVVDAPSQGSETITLLDVVNSLYSLVALNPIEFKASNAISLAVYDKIEVFTHEEQDFPTWSFNNTIPNISMY